MISNSVVVSIPVVYGVDVSWILSWSIYVVLDVSDLDIPSVVTSLSIDPSVVDKSLFIVGIVARMSSVCACVVLTLESEPNVSKMGVNIFSSKVASIAVVCSISDVGGLYLQF